MGDAGGRNVTVSLQSRTGHTSMLGVVGMLIFTQYWYWFPLTHFLCLAFQPTAVIGLNTNLDMPVVKIRSGAKPSTYGYPPALEDKKKVTTAVLSITNKQKKKEAEKKKGKDGEDKMDVDEKKDDKKEKMEVDEKKEEEKKEEKKEEEKKADEPEPNFELLSN